jgi:hypothetical protein
MSSPFPFEEEAQTNAMRGEWNPWQGPAEPHWYSGMGFNDESHYLGPFGRALDAAGAGAAKGEAVLGGLIHQAQQPDSAPSQGFEQPDTKPAFPELGSAIAADAKMRVQAMTPNPTTTGSAVQLLHGLVSGFTEMSIGGLAAGPGGAATVVGSSEGLQRYHDLIDAGVDDATARKSALLAGGTAAAGALVPAGVGATLAAKVTSGAIGNTAFGIANRYADHKILESAGYPEMAAQQKIIDGTQIITDLILGASFGGLAHLHGPEVEALRNAPGARDAALTANLAIRDRKSAPGIAADPEAANAHQAALETSIADLMQGKQVDVSDSGVTSAKFVERPESRVPEIETAVREAIKETGLFGEANERDVDAILDGRPIETAPIEAENPVEPAQDRTQEMSGYILFRGSGEAGYPLVLDREQMMRNRLENAKPLNQEGLSDEHNNAFTEAFNKEARDSFDEKGIFTGKPFQVTNARGVYHFDTLDAARRFAETHGMRSGKRRQLTEESALQNKASEPESIKTASAALAREGEATAEQAPEAETVAKVLEQNPDLTIPDENGQPVSAREAMDKANEEVATTRKESTIAAKAAITCYMRKGN